MIKTKQWIFKNKDEVAFKQLKESMPEVGDHLLTLLSLRNIQTKEQAKQFVNPSLEQLHDPYLLSDMAKASVRIKEAIVANEPILIYGDYDVDGTTSVAMLWDFLNYLHRSKHPEDKKTNLFYYIPNRFTEGYGVSKQGIQYAIDNDISLIITVDCGIKDHKAIASAEATGIEVIVCDHHEPGANIPNCFAVLNPKKENCPYPFKDLSGCGVAFKLIQATLNEFNKPIEKAFDYLDYVVISTIADVVSLQGENRILAWKGLEKINNNPADFVKAMYPLVLKYGEAVTAMDIGFKIAPLINAAGRMEHANKAVEFFIADNMKERKDHLNELNELNELRKSIDRDTFDEAINIIDNSIEEQQKSSIVLHDKNWHIGTVGIVASRLIERYYKPTFILTEIEEGLYAGSGRSIPGLNLVEALEEQAENLSAFGGHYYAAGVRLSTEHLTSFSEQFENSVQNLLKVEDVAPTLEIDTSLELNQISEKLSNTIKRFEPCGQENPSPIFASYNIPIKDIYREIIKEKHLKLTFLNTQVIGTNTNGYKREYKLVAMGFNQAEQFERLALSGEDKIDIAYSIIENVFNRSRSVQLRLIDIKKSQS